MRRYEPVISFNLHGELGNQMFQWAAGYAFSSQNNVPVSFLTLPRVESRMSEFKTANNFHVASANLVDNPDSILLKILRKIGVKSIFGDMQKETGLNYQEIELKESRNYHGYFQSWRYFHHIRDEILQQFELQNPSTNFFELKETLPKHFTAIHIRRGGPGAAVLTSDYHGLLDTDYYKRAIELNEELGGSRNYIVFTDNPEKASVVVEQLDLNNPRIIGPKDSSSQCENLILMTYATSFIGANSSYSWWAAYLSESLQTRPIFPRQWYMDPDISNTDMLLPDWVTVGFSKFLNEKQPRGINLEQ
jgi:hypothetical protein